MRFRNGGTRDLGTGFGRSEIVEQKNEGDRVIGNRCVPTFWNADIDRGAELGVPEVFAAVAVGDQGASFWIAACHLRDERFGKPVRRVSPVDGETPGLAHLASPDTK